MAEKKVKKKILYEKFVEENMATKEQEAISKQFGVEKERIIVKKESSGAKLISVLSSGVIILVKVLIGIITGALVSFALTVLLNTQLREAVFEIMKTW